MKPGFTASHFAVHEGCAAAYAREMEMAWFCQDLGIEGPDTGGALAERGQRLHAILAAIPYTGNGMGPTGFRFWPAIYEAANANAVTLKAGDRWFLRECIQRRDALIDLTVNEVRKAYGGVGRVEFVPDSTRYYAGVELPDGSTEWPSGRPDFVAIVYDPQGVARRAVIADYKSGYAHQGTEEANAQLRMLAVLLAVHFPTLDEVLVSLLARADLKPGEVTGFRYDIEALGTRHYDRVQATVVASAALASPFFETGTADPSEEHQAALTQAGNVTVKCLFCAGKVCCQSIQAYLAEHAGVIDSQRTDLQALLDRLAPPKPKKEKKVKEGKAKAPEPVAEEPEQPKDPMNVTQLAECSASIRKHSLALDLAEKLREELNTVIRQVVATGQVVPNHLVQPGAQTLSVLKEEGSYVSLDVAFDRLSEAGLLPGKSREDVVAKAGAIDAQGLRELVSETNAITPDEAVALIAERLGPKAPILLNAKAGTVKCHAPVMPVAPSVANDAVPLAAVADGPRRRR